jgi:D-lactate dehydrogenase (cytochrome)
MRLLVFRIMDFVSELRKKHNISAAGLSRGNSSGACGGSFSLDARRQPDVALNLNRGMIFHIVEVTMNQQLLDALRALCGPAAVIADAEALRPYSHDWIPGDYRLPDAVVRPSAPEQIPQIVALAAAAGLPIVARGAGTGLAGGARPRQGGLVLSTAALTQIERVDLANRAALVQPGLITYELSAALADAGWFYAPDPASWKLCTIGGTIANNSGGPRCLKYGVTTNHVLGLELTLHDGRSLWTGDGVQDAAGYDLTGLVVGSEGTFGVVGRALLRLTRAPEANRVAMALFADTVAACSAVSAILAAGQLPTALEVMDGTTMLAVNRAQGAGLPAEAGAALIVELDGVNDGLDEALAECVAICRGHGAIDVRTARTADEQERLWAARRSAFASFHTIAPSYYLVDTVVPRTRLPAMMAHVTQLSAEHGLPIANVFHAGDGNLHPLVLYDPADPAQVAKAHAITAAVLAQSIAEGGAVSGEHGIGVEKQAFLARLYGPAELEAQAAVYAVFNPLDRLNPGKVFPQDTHPLELAARQRARLAPALRPRISAPTACGPAAPSSPARSTSWRRCCGPATRRAPR